MLRSILLSVTELLRVASTLLYLHMHYLVITLRQCCCYCVWTVLVHVYTSMYLSIMTNWIQGTYFMLTLSCCYVSSWCNAYVCVYICTLCMCTFCTYSMCYTVCMYVCMKMLSCFWEYQYSHRLSLIPSLVPLVLNPADICVIVVPWASRVYGFCTLRAVLQYSRGRARGNA